MMALTVIAALGICAVGAAVAVPTMLGGVGAWPVLVGGVVALIIGLGGLWLSMRRRDRTLR